MDLEPIAKEDAQEVLTPYISRLNKVIVGNINYYYNGPQYAAVRHQHSPRTDASICHDLIINGLRTEFEGTPFVRFVTKKGLFMMIIREVVVLRFKKFNDKLLSSGIRTQQAMFYNLQDTISLELDGMPPDGLLHIGYIPNELETGVGEIHVTYRYGDVNVWSWDITSEQVSDVVPYPLVVAKDTTKIRKPRVKGKEKNVGDIDAGNL